MADQVPAPISNSRGVRLSYVMLSPIMIAIVLAEVACFVAFLRGRMTWMEYLGAAFAGIIGAYGVTLPPLLKIIDGWTRQDEAKINAAAPRSPIVQVTTGDGSTANSTNVTTTPADSTTTKHDIAGQ